MFKKLDNVKGTATVDLIVMCERRGNEMFEKLQLDRFFPKKNFLESRRLVMIKNVVMTMKVIPMTSKCLGSTPVPSSQVLEA